MVKSVGGSDRCIPVNSVVGAGAGKTVSEVQLSEENSPPKTPNVNKKSNQKKILDINKVKRDKIKKLIIIAAIGALAATATALALAFSCGIVAVPLLIIFLALLAAANFNIGVAIFAALKLDQYPVTKITDDALSKCPQYKQSPA